MPHDDPYWGWCAQPGAARATTLVVDQTNYGDGYIHRATRGLNPARPGWSLVFPFVGLGELQSFDDFLVANSARGFWFTPPDGTADVFVTCDTWSATIADTNRAMGIVGTLQATFTRQFNPQPINPLAP
jgi:phage-related protein